MARFALVMLMLLCCPLAGIADERKLELRGEIVPPFRWAPVIIQSTNDSFRKQIRASYSGEFKFKNLEPGLYTIHVLSRRWGQARKSVEVTPSFADEKGRVTVRVVFRRSQADRLRHLEDRSMVAVHELSVSKQARKRYSAALKKLERNDPEAARGLFQEAVNLSPQFCAAWIQLGVMAYKSKDLPQAESHFQEVLAIDPESFAANVNLGAVLLGQRRFEEALHYNSKASRLEPGDVLANAQLGINYFELGNLEDAVPHLRRAKRADPGHSSLPQLTLAQIYATRGEWQRAVRELTDLQQRHPDGPAAEVAQRAMARLKRLAASASFPVP